MTETQFYKTPVYAQKGLNYCLSLTQLRFLEYYSYLKHKMLV